MFKYKKITLFLFIALSLFAFCSVSAEEKDENDKVLEQVIEKAKSYMVAIEYRFRDPAGIVDPSLMTSQLVEPWKKYWKTGEPYYSTGFLVEKDKVLCPMFNALPEIVKSVRVQYIDGTYVDAKLDAFVLNIPASILMLSEPAKADPPKFEDNFNFTKGTPYYYAGFSRVKDFFQVWAYPDMCNFESTGSEYFERSAGLLVFNAKGVPVGVSFFSSYWGDGKRTNWKATDFLNSPKMTIVQYRKYIEDFQNIVEDSILPVRIEIRRKSAGNEDPILYGVCVDGNGTIVVPSEMRQEHIKSIKTINVRYQGKEQKANFVGQLKNYSAFVINVPGIPQAKSIAIKGISTELFQLLFSVRYYSVKNKVFTSGQPLYYSYYFREFDNKYYPIEYSGRDSYGRRGRSQGDFIFDGNGACLGVTLFYTKDWAIASDYYSRDALSSSGTVRFVPFSELAPVASAPSGKIVENLYPMTLQESRKTLWLGVELQGLGTALAEYLGILEQTNYGELGGRIIHVYPGSPAHKAGLRIGDVLLDMGRKGDSNKIEFTPRLFATSYWHRYPWASRRTDLFTSLSKLDTKSDIELRFIRDKEEKKTVFKLEVAPVDFVAAKFYKCHELGFRVKELSYEVRMFFKLTEKDKGVLVYRVESGSKATIAELGSFDIVTKINGVAVSTAEEFKTEINKAIESEDENVSLEINRLGETRFIEIKKPSAEEIKKIREEHQVDEEDETGEK